MHFLWRGFLIFILTIPSLGGAVVVTDNQESGICQNGAMVHKEYCQFFIYYRNAKADKLDIRISDALQIPDQDASKTRAIGLIIAISKYPALNANLEAAEVDGKRLANFLIYGQKFDEVILLKDQDATAENIDYFLKDYLPARGEMFNKKAGY
ncbi:hypothetical protein R4P48_19155 [Atlantibacter subterranea]|uniref:Uncharacterized protein n=1 Tax=Atlantibacter subterraneus TaxID=255519 RepID=A0ABU4E6Q4_9ENTR|nr:hypothetical protein [Atlantibacter subterranea]MDV7024783.1 hypothetical protein [Atlantibacter subterranea]MDZ5667976.1 hypothetical protein [Atlantibacter hermannii]